jgi:hypothetical protein
VEHFFWDISVQWHLALRRSYGKVRVLIWLVETRAKALGFNLVILSAAKNLILTL